MTIHRSRADLPVSFVEALSIDTSLPASITALLQRRPGLLTRLRAWLHRRADRPPRAQSWMDIPSHLRRDIGLPDGPLPPSVLHGWRR